MLQFKTVPWDSALSLVLLYLALLAPAASSAREVQAPGIAKRGLSQDALLGNANISGTSNRTVSLEYHIISSTGSDMSDHFPILYDHQADPPSNKSKRAVSRPINQAYCPPNHDFLRSRCAGRPHTPGTWSLVCRARPGEPMGNALRWGQCGEGEVCIEGRPREAGIDQNWEWLQETAWCVETLNFISILSKSKGRSGSFMGQIEAGVEGEDGSGYLVEALLTSKDSKRLLDAQWIEILAQRHGSGGSWQTLNQGDSRCFGCSSVKLDGVPRGTERIVADVKLMPGITEGLLYLASVG